LVELPSQHRLKMALAGGDAVDAYPWWVSPQPIKRTCRNRSVAGSNPARPTKNNAIFQTRFWLVLNKATALIDI